MGLFTVDEPTRRVGRLATRDMRPSSRPSDLSLTTSDVDGAVGRSKGLSTSRVTNVQEPVYKLPTYKPPLFAAPVPEEPQSRPHTRGHDVSDINVKSYPTRAATIWTATGGSRPDTAAPLPDTRRWRPATAPVRDIMRVRDISHPAPHTALRRDQVAAATGAPAGAQMLRVWAATSSVMPGHVSQSAPVTARAAAPAAAASSSSAASRPMTARPPSIPEAAMAAASCDAGFSAGGGDVERWVRPQTAEGPTLSRPASARPASALVPRPSSARPSSAHIVAAGARPRPASARPSSARPSSARPSTATSIRPDWSYEESAATMSELQPTRGRTAGSVPPSSGGEPSLRAPSRPASARSAYQQSRVMEERRADVLAVWALPR